MSNATKKGNIKRFCVAILAMLFVVMFLLAATFLVSHNCGDCDEMPISQYNTELCVACTSAKKWHGLLSGGLLGSSNLALISLSFFSLILLFFTLLSIATKTPIIKKDIMNN